MANISTASGKLTLYSSDKKTIDILLKAFKYLEGIDYFTIIKDDGEIHKTDPNSYEKTVSFFGAGRWTYEMNIENFGQWIYEMVPKEDKEITDHLHGSDYRLEYDFIDKEPSEDIHYKAKIVSTHIKGQPVHLHKTETIEVIDI